MQNHGDERDPRHGSDREHARRTALGGLLAALALLFISISAISPTADLALMTLASLCMAIAVIENGAGSAFVLYAAVSLLSAFWPGIAFSWPFIAFFGFFPLVKAFAEKRWPQLPAAIFKLTVSSVLILAAIAVFAVPALRDYVNRYTVWIMPALLAGGLLVVLVYDYALTLLIALYLGRRPRR